MPAEEVGFVLDEFPDLEFITMNQGEKRKFAFLETIPNRDFPVTKIKEHYIAEKQGSKYIMCTGGLCCQYKTWNNFEKGYVQSKAKTLYWVPCVFYYSDRDTMMPKADIGILSLNYFQYKKYLDQINMIVPGGMSFFDQDIMVSFDKSGNFNDYTFTVQNVRAKWKDNPEMKATIEERLQTLAERIKACYPVEYTEIELAAEIEKWNAVKAAKMAEEAAVDASVANVATQPVVDANVQVATAQPVAQAVVNTPSVNAQPVQQVVNPQVQPIATPVQQVTPTPVQTTAAQPVVQPAATPVVESTPTTVAQSVPDQPAPAVNTVPNENFTLNDLASVLQTPAAE